MSVMLVTSEEQATLPSVYTTPDRKEEGRAVSPSLLELCGFQRLGHVHFDLFCLRFCTLRHVNAEHAIMRVIGFNLVRVYACGKG